MQRHVLPAAVALTVSAGFVIFAAIGDADEGRTSAQPANGREPHLVAHEIDRLLERDFRESETEVAPLANDEDFLRRVTLDIAGTIPAAEKITLFGLDPDPHKRQQRIDELLETEAYAENWARYWRDVIFSRATEMRSRIAQPVFEDWMASQLESNRPWDAIVSDMLTASGDVLENGSAALLFAHGADAAELAGETSRIFLGIQIQCANCHDHPTDAWKREQFHQLAAFFPRMALRPKRDGAGRSFEVVSVNTAPNRGRRFEPERIVQFFDRNRDNKLTKREVAGTRFAEPFERAISFGDTNQDGALSLQELKDLPRPDDRRRTLEYRMPDLDNPASEGTRIDPQFFLAERVPRQGLDDAARRRSLAQFVTSPRNPWFAKAMVNRIWSELVGEGFSMPIDDMGPERTPAHPEVLDLLAEGWIGSGYDTKWLFRTILNTDAYQRQLPGTSDSSSTAFAAACPSRLRADQLFNSILTVLGVDEPSTPAGRGQYARMRAPRVQFGSVFEFDPSMPKDDLVGEVPQALFMMNSPVLNNLIRAEGNTRLGRLLAEFDNDDEAVSELYLLVLAREPTEGELAICRDYVADVGDRKEGFEDLMWALFNSAEFISKR